MNLRDVAVEFRELPTSLIDEPELPARAGMDIDKLDELTADVKAKGVLVPISVVRSGERFEVIAGHRRRIAAGRAGVPTIRCLIYPTKQLALEAVKWSENRYREDLSVAEEAAYFHELLNSQCGGDTNQLCALLGEKRTYVEGRLLLFQGAPEVFNALAERKITIGVAHELNKCTEKLMRDYFLDRAIRDGASIAMVTGWIQQWRNTLVPAGSEKGFDFQAAAPAAVATSNYFRCYVCGGEHDIHEMRPVNVHGYCEKAILDPLLRAYREGAAPNT
jgi:ParB family transcriptional regulator, chromosome partitioning protein